jgi:nitrogen fixation protein NifU and related proteins
MNIYQERLMDHYRHPRHRGIIENADFTSGVHNPSCGDAVSVSGCIENGIITALAFDGVGCVISQATASMLAEAVFQKTVEYALNFDKDALIALVSVQCGPTRLKCVLLALDALHGALNAQQA